MTARIIDLRLRRIEKRVGASVLSRMSDEALNALIRSNLEVAARPHNGNIVAVRDDLKVSGSYEEREIARDLDDVIEYWDELYSPTKTG